MQTYKIFSGQTGPHPDLVNVVRRFKNSRYQRPIAIAQESSYRHILNFVTSRNRPIILDSGCGTGHSSHYLALHYPEHDIIGIDKSHHRLSRHNAQNLPNLLLVRAELIDVWRLLGQERLPITHHFLLYPNPWPKVGHLKRRFHAHPVFVPMLQLAPYFEVRTNWQIYAEELMVALRELGQQPKLSMESNTTPMSLFEKKYLAAHCKIFIVRNQLISFD